MDLGLKDKRAVVTGGSRGIGLAVGRALAQEGADVALVGRNAQAAAEQAAALAADTGARVIGIGADTGDDASVATMAAAAIEQLGGVDILVNNAAMTNPGVIAESALEAEINVKVRGYLRCARAFAPGMVERGWGRIINVGGAAARRTGSVTGSIRNVAVAALTKNLADELGPRGVNVTVVHPGPTRSDTMATALAANAESRGLTVEEVEREFSAAISIGRIVTPDEVAAVIAFLASPRSVALNGDPIIASGGELGPIYY
ncbi:SDR family NAD(P)-dependent oxidoreductase [Streptomyces sp. TLI_185]|uniref:SDR family NAD(P)-dependent oxidoreductase n=1 Tax=Streptomyces sp. TLI_185 TaxID=2485151 RepID=UPI000F4FB300|nr:SDR family oxidoreductase [Streptomyces sp. TLI_185]RPF30559.1 short-subunit dehydrogenase [Streptomyces sp. TLI_185]